MPFSSQTRLVQVKRAVVRIKKNEETIASQFMYAIIIIIIIIGMSIIIIITVIAIAVEPTTTQ